jgi:hypothetical protein
MDEDLMWFKFLEFFNLVFPTYQLEEHAFIAYLEFTQFLWSSNLYMKEKGVPTRKHPQLFGDWVLRGKGSHDECLSALEAL